MASTREGRLFRAGFYRNGAAAVHCPSLLPCGDTIRPPLD